MIHESISSKYSIVIAIDFGTSRSGFNFSYTDFAEVQNCQQYPGDKDKIPYAKTISEIIYPLNNNRPHWGYPARTVYEDGEKHEYSTIYKRFKLGLSNKDEPPFFPLDENNNRTNDSRPLIDLISDYLSGMKEHAFTFLKLPNQLIPEKKILWCLSIPAMWSHVEKKRMRESAVKAGLITNSADDIDRLRLIYEPEAAAIYCFQTLGNEQNKLKPGERFMVIDSGGGTIDITSYEILYNKQLKELTTTNGEKCGSTFVDKEFLEFIGNPKNQIFPSYLVNNLEKNIIYDLIDNWEKLKCDPNLNKTTKVSYRFPISFYEYITEKHPDICENLKIKQNGKKSELFLTQT